MEPLFDQNCDLVGWIDPSRHIFDAEMNWVAFIVKGNAWSAETGQWCGPVNGTICLDRSGQVVAWNPKQEIVGTLRQAPPARVAGAPRPERPPLPELPDRPPRPAFPMGGWSRFSFWRWLSQQDGE